MTTPILKNIRVLDLSRVLAGPLCGQLLADLGADVIKVERPGSGDDSRAWGPPYLADTNGEPTGESAFYCACNRGKRSITIDLHKPAGRDLVKKFAVSSDVVLENYKAGTLEKYGLGYDALSKCNPKLIRSGFRRAPFSMTVRRLCSGSIHTSCSRRSWASPSPALPRCKQAGLAVD